MGELTNNKLETLKSVNSLPALKNRGFSLSQRHSKEERLHVQTVFKGCILLSSITSCIQKVCPVSLVGKALRVSLTLIWTRSITKKFYKITQIFSFHVKSPEHLFGRHVDRPYNQRNVNGQK